jgi:hypothetical protein
MAKDVGWAFEIPIRLGDCFSINLRTGNFVRADSLGWLLDKGTMEDHDTVSITRGTCSKF